MLTNRDLIFSVLYATMMCAVFGANTWLVYFKFRQCIKHLEDRDKPAPSSPRQRYLVMSRTTALARAEGVF